MFGQLIEYSMSNIVLEKEYTKCDGEAIPRPFSKKSKLSLSLGQQPEFFCRFSYAETWELLNLFTGTKTS